MILMLNIVVSFQTVGAAAQRSLSVANTTMGEVTISRNPTIQ